MAVEYRVVWRAWKEQKHGLITYEGPDLKEAERVFSYQTTCFYESGGSTYSPAVTLEKRVITKHQTLKEAISGTANT